MGDGLDVSKVESTLQKRSRLHLQLRRKTKFRLAAAFVAGCFAVGIAECALRVLQIGYPQLYTADRFCGSRLRAGASGWWTSEGHSYVSVNRFGMRGPETSISKPDNVTRVAESGDVISSAVWTQP